SKTVPRAIPAMRTGALRARGRGSVIVARMPQAGPGAPEIHPRALGPHARAAPSVAAASVVTGLAMFRKVALLSLLCPLLCAGLAHADEGEPSRPEPPAAFSTQSARTLTKGRTAAYAGLGWPGLRVGGYLSPADAFDIGFQGQLLMGSPIM